MKCTPKVRQKTIGVHFIWASQSLWTDSRVDSRVISDWSSASK